MKLLKWDILADFLILWITWAEAFLRALELDMNLFSIQNLRGLKTSFLNEKSYQKVAKALVLNGRKLTVKMNCLTWIKFYDRCFLQYFFALRHFLSLEKKSFFAQVKSKLTDIQGSLIVGKVQTCWHYWWETPRIIKRKSCKILLSWHA